MGRCARCSRSQRGRAWGAVAVALLGGERSVGAALAADRRHVAHPPEPVHQRQAHQTIRRRCGRVGEPVGRRMTERRLHATARSTAACCARRGRTGGSIFAICSCSACSPRRSRSSRRCRSRSSSTASSATSRCPAYLDAVIPVGSAVDDTAARSCSPALLPASAAERSSRSAVDEPTSARHRRAASTPRLPRAAVPPRRSASRSRSTTARGTADSIYRIQYDAAGAPARSRSTASSRSSARA